MKNKFLVLGIIITVFCCSCGTRLPEAGDYSATDSSISGKAAAERAEQKIARAELSTPVVEDKKYRLALPAVEEILKEFKYQAYLAGWYEKVYGGRNITAFFDYGYETLKEGGLFDKELKVKVYYKKERGVGESLRDTKLYSIVCAVSVPGEKKRSYIFEMTCGQEGFFSGFRGTDRDIDSFTCLGEGRVTLKQEEAEKFVFQPENTQERQQFIGLIKKRVEEHYSKRKKGRYIVYVQNFMDSDMRLRGTVIAPYSKGKASLESFWIEKCFQDSRKCLGMNDVIVVPQFDCVNGSSYEAYEKEMQPTEKVCGLVWEFEVD